MRINPDSAVDMAESAGTGSTEDNLSLKNRIRPAAYLFCIFCARFPTLSVASPIIPIYMNN